ncbi:c-type cytochrome [Aestuariicoccus sp. MJ-SS9]|uniref:c-type cytochrome n=1 Tax=Aestuariicoccus sp. MJ-SS9 TaxID=3079855 RepID=UPI00290D73EC|nr:c-type cytochrome [Aestuariicoccus sp. MJ-SS9]MDU8913233.1 cytochrome c [Aestuariicoccus sp. MJ-SS9]
MIKSILSAALLAGAFAGAAWAQEDAGRAEYMVACAGCHGESGKGDGPLAGVLDMHTPDLTHLARDKGDGTFPFEYVLWMIDGREIIRAHGSEMPLWGDRYTVSAMAAEESSELPEARELFVRGRILSLVYYLESIQAQ